MTDFSQTLSKIKFISCLQAGDKINTKWLGIQKSSILTKILRTMHDENRGNTLNFVQCTINRSFELITAYNRSDKESDRVMCAHLIKDLHVAKQGLKNLKETYISDVKFCCDMDTLLQVIDAKLSGVEGKYIDHIEATSDI